MVKAGLFETSLDVDALSSLGMVEECDGVAERGLVRLGVGKMTSLSMRCHDW